MQQPAIDIMVGAARLLHCPAQLNQIALLYYVCLNVYIPFITTDIALNCSSMKGLIPELPGDTVDDNPVYPGYSGY